MPDIAATTPLLEQYERVKRQYPGHLVLFRVGDFFETFGDDAKLVARELDIVLTARSADASGQRTPMAGVPQHAVDQYLSRLVRKGYKVALCDQVEDARFARGLVRREVTRVVTPGTTVEDRLLDGPDHNFLACVVVPSSGPGLYSAVDITTGEWFRGAAETPGTEGLLARLAPFDPSEILWTAEGSSFAGGLERALRAEYPRARIEPAPPPLSVAERGAWRLGGATDVDWSASDERLATYVAHSQPRLVPYLELIPDAAQRRALHLDAKTLRHLEIARPMNPDDPTGPTLLAAWDESVTAPGRRTLSFWLRHPLADVTAIEQRLDQVEALVERGGDLLLLRAELKSVADLARIGSRVASRRTRPPELFALRTSLLGVERARAWLSSGAGSSALAGLADRLAPIPGLLERLTAALPEAVTAPGEPGVLFRAGFSTAFDAAARDEQDALGALEALERREQEASGIRGLKLGYNQVFGYYFEVTRPHLARVPAHFRRKQTIANGERFTSDELGQLETTILAARERKEAEEASGWERLLAEVEAFVPALHRLSRAVGELDALATFALIAQERRLVRPVVDGSRVLQVREGRHPILDRALDGAFVPNDTDLDGETSRLLVLTGPNMSGKSTYMRQVGLLVVLAQAGSFVPAKFARVGCVSSLYTRMGFTDAIGRGKSSFMVEMSEVAEILRGADAHSLVLLDEVGRGTSTFDGLALAWATLRHLHDTTGSRTLLATHYHQLTELVESLAAARNAHLAVREAPEGIVFLHRLVPGSTDRSYGLHVARLAGMPAPLVGEAERLLKRLEAQGLAVRPGPGRAAPSRYTQAILLPSVAEPSAVEGALLSLDPDHLTPMEALRWITQWRERLRAAPPGPPP